MSERIQQFTGSSIRRVKYPWSEWADGSIWRIRQGDDYTSASSSMRSYLYRMARELGSKVSVSEVDAQTLEFQFTPLNPVSS